MFRRIEAVGYRCLREVSQKLNPFEILVGPNGSGKSAFLDVIQFLGDFVKHGLNDAVRRRSSAFQDLVWGREGDRFRFSADIEVPSGESTLTYTLGVLLNQQEGRLEISDEAVSFHSAAGFAPIISRSGDVVRYRHDSGSEEISLRIPRSDSSVLNYPGDEWPPFLSGLLDLLAGVRTVELNTRELKTPSALEAAGETMVTGASLAWQIHRLADRHPAKLTAWTTHVRTALPDVCKIDSVIQQWDNRRFVRIQYDNGLQVPAWMLSEGTLCFLALTILAYLPDFRGVYLIEEPENAVHPAALESIYQSLSSVYDAQVMVSTHSPVLLSMAKPEQILCFAKTRAGTGIVRGDKHPALKDWQGEVSLGALVASGILS